MHYFPVCRKFRRSTAFFQVRCGDSDAEDVDFLLRCGFGSDHRVMEMPAGYAGRSCVFLNLEMLAGTPERPLRLPERRLTSVPAISGTPYVPFLAKVMPNFFVKFGMTLLKIGHMGYCD
jgi:hypothetical protein